MAFENNDPTHLGPFTLGAVTKPRSIVTYVAGKLEPATSKTVRPLGVIALDQRDLDNGAVTKELPTKVQYHAIARVIADGSGTAILDGDVLEAGADGVAVKGDITTLGWTIGTALQGCTAADEYISALIQIQYSQV